LKVVANPYVIGCEFRVPKPIEHNSARAIAQQRDSKTRNPKLACWRMRSFLIP